MSATSTAEKDQHTDPVCDMTVSTDSEYSLHFADKQYFSVVSIACTALALPVFFLAMIADMLPTWLPIVH